MKDICIPISKKRRRSRFVRSVLLAWLFAVAVQAASAATFVVNSTVDIPTSQNLRRAILDANGNPGLDIIVFDFTAYPVTLTFSTPLPDITESVVIDGADPNGCLADMPPRIQLDGIGLGPNANGLVARGTASSPIGVTIQGLAIYRFPGTGILLERNTNSVIAGNHLGTDASGAMPLPNDAGLVLDTCREAIVGGAAPCQRNVISGNRRGGLEIYNGADHRVLNNLVGLSANGQWAVPNRIGVALHFGQRCQIGSLLQGEGNVISWNQQEGVLVNGALGVPMESRIEGNFIGTQAGGGFPAPNGGDGVHFFGGPTRNHVRGNVIAHNGGSGVMVLEGIDNEIVENSIFRNAFLGIDLSPRFVPNANDPCDADEGPNRQQNFPVLGAAASFPTSLRIDGSLDCESGRTYRLDFYWNPACDPFGFGEGRHYIGQATVSNTNAGQCVVPFEFSFPTPVSAGVVVTATATHAEGSTSEFSACVPVAGGGVIVVNHAGLPHLPLGGSTLTPQAGGTLQVDAPAGGNSNGVEIVLGRAGGWTGELHDLQMGDGESFSVEGESAPLNPHPEPKPVEAVKVVKILYEPPDLSLITSLTSAMAFARFTLTGENDEPQDSAPLPPNGKMQWTLCTPPEQIAIASSRVEAQASGGFLIAIRLADSVCVRQVTPAGLRTFSVRTIQLVQESAHLPAIQSLRLRRTADPSRARAAAGATPGTSWSLGLESLRQFDNPHRAAGLESMAAWRDNWRSYNTTDPAVVFITLSNAPGAVPEPGGVSVQLDRTRYICAAIDPTADSALGAIRGLHFNACTNPVPGTRSDALDIRASERGWLIDFAFPVSGTITGRFDLYRQGVPVQSLTAITGTQVRASSPPLRAARSTSRFTPLGDVGFALYWPEPTSIFADGPGAGFDPTTGALMADELRIVPVNPATPLPWLSRFDVRVSGPPSFEILREVNLPARPGPLSITRAPGGGVRLSYPTEAGRPYVLEYKSSLNSPAWELLESFLGDGSVRQFNDAFGPGGNRFYRLGGL